MARRKSFLEDLMELSLRRAWAIAVGLAVVSFGVLHMIAAEAPARIVGRAMGDSGSVFVWQFFLSIAALLQVIVPMALLAGAVGSLLRRSRGNALLDRAAADHAAAIHGMSWSEFEQLVEEAFRRQGYAVSANTGGPHRGVDMILTNDKGQFQLQCKHWRSRQVGVSAIREHFGVMCAHGAAGGFVVTSGIFTPDAAALAARARIELIDGPKLIAMVQGIQRRSSDTRTLEQKVVTARSRLAGAEAMPPHCPRCGGSMMIRTARRGAATGGKFWGCKRFPKCQGTLPT